MMKEKNQRLKSTKETSLFNPGGIDAKNAPKIERMFPTVMEKKRAFVLRESVLGAEEEKEKERIQFPLTTIGEDFSIGQSNAKKEGKAMKVRGQRNECLENTN